MSPLRNAIDLIDTWYGLNTTGVCDTFIRRLNTGRSRLPEQSKSSTMGDKNGVVATIPTKSQYYAIPRGLAKPGGRHFYARVPGRLYTVSTHLVRTQIRSTIYNKYQMEREDAQDRARQVCCPDQKKLGIVIVVSLQLPAIIYSTIRGMALNLQVRRTVSGRAERQHRTILLAPTHLVLYI